MQKNGFVGAELIKIRGRLSEATSHGEREAAGQKPAQTHATVTVPPPETVIDREWRKALEKRWDEFRILKRDFTGRLTENLASLPEEIRLAKEHAEQLQSALEKFAHLLDQMETIDDSAWNKDNFSTELAVAMRRIEHIRLEYLRVTSKLDALQRESYAAEGGESSSLIPEICSISWRQGFKIGLSFLMPVIITIILGSFIVAIAMLLALR
ncbi:MAG TPA: hypothetical protein DCZ94_10095 [Lentisphaeria bacterium]|nr:MAG: hypothetical protein A2X48_08505 [Lentisphaerae bacterium GWF2_49_21]HBC87295.1 hypothetical protein [Lentisphaeria bacterium]